MYNTFIMIESLRRKNLLLEKNLINKSLKKTEPYLFPGSIFDKFLVAVGLDINDRAAVIYAFQRKVENLLKKQIVVYLLKQ